MQTILNSCITDSGQKNQWNWKPPRREPVHTLLSAILFRASIVLVKVSISVWYSCVWEMKSFRFVFGSIEVTLSLKNTQTLISMHTLVCNALLDISSISKGSTKFWYTCICDIQEFQFLCFGPQVTLNLKNSQKSISAHTLVSNVLLDISSISKGSTSAWYTYICDIQEFQILCWAPQVTLKLKSTQIEPGTHHWVAVIQE